MEIPAASLGQVTRARDGHLVEVAPELCQIAKELSEIQLPTDIGIDSTLKLRVNDREGVFIVYQERRRSVDGELLSKGLVTTWNCKEAGPVTGRLVDRVKLVCSGHYDLAAELARMDAAEERDREHRLEEQIGAQAEVLQHALLKDKGLKRRAFIPRGI